MYRDPYARNLDLNLLRVFLAVAERGSVTAAAEALYLTQPAVSAALRRLTAAIGAPLFAKQGRGLTLTTRGAALLVAARPHLAALLEAAFQPLGFDPKASDRTLRVGLSDATEVWLLPALLRALEAEAPRMRVVSVPVQFRTVADALASRSIDAAVTVADELPSGLRRKALFVGGFVCLFDPRHARVKKTLGEREYFEHEHVIVSYAGDLRGVVEDVVQKTRRVRCSVSSFNNLGAVVDGSALLATVPAMVAAQIRQVRPHLAVRPLPFRLARTPMELLWRAADDDDPAGIFLRDKIATLAVAAANGSQRSI